MKRARFFCKTGPLAGQEYQIGAEATIGRGEQNTITLSPGAIAEEHARIYYDDDEKCYLLENRSLPDNTQIDGTAVSDTIPLRKLHVITLGGEVDFIFHRAPPGTRQRGESVPAEDAGEKTQIAGTPPVKPALPGEAEDPPGDETRIGADLGAMPDLSDGDDRAEDRTRVGMEIGAMPDLPDEDDQGDDSEAGERTQIDGDVPAMPDLPGEAEEPPADDETRVGADMGAMPSLSDEEAPSTPELPREEASASASASKYAVELTVEDGPQEERHVLPQGPTTIGRSDECGLHVDNRGVSREHARLVVDAGRVRLEDMGSKNFTFVNGERISGSASLQPGDAIHLGLQVKLVLQSN